MAISSPPFLRRSEQRCKHRSKTIFQPRKQEATLQMARFYKLIVRNVPDLLTLDDIQWKTGERLCLPEPRSL